MAPVVPVGRPHVLIGWIGKNRPQYRAGAEPDQDGQASGREGLPGSAAPDRPEPARREHDERDADGGAVRVADDVAEAGIAARDPLLQKLDGRRQSRPDRDRAQRRHAGEHERGAEGDEEQEVLDELGEGGVAGGEGERPSGRELGARGVEGGDEDAEGGERDGGDRVLVSAHHGFMLAPTGGKTKRPLQFAAASDRGLRPRLPFKVSKNTKERGLSQRSFECLIAGACRGWDSNPHGRKPSTLKGSRVYQFHHPGPSAIWFSPWCFAPLRHAQVRAPVPVESICELLGEDGDHLDASKVRKPRYRLRSAFFCSMYASNQSMILRT